ncbi:WD40-repeat-containing domain protein [Xylaria palmicola]|nr:WD40-repeat-containing domain protein [Xylaria palmicola]
MGEENTEVEYLCVGANRHTAVADWSRDGLLAFGADSNIALWRPHDSQPRGVTSLLAGHKDTVKTIKFLTTSEGEEAQTYLLSGADDHCLKIWAFSQASTGGAVSCIQTLREHTAAINCIATLCEGTRGSPTTGPAIFATGAADASIKIWAFDGREARVLQTIHPKPKFFPLAIALSSLDARGEALVLAAAGTRDIVQVFVAAGPAFELQATLTGHEGWIRSLDFTREAKEKQDGDDDADLLLASASQDKYIRLWRLHRGRELPAAAADGADPSLGAYLPGKSPSNKAHRLRAAGGDFTVTFEALLLGHDDWIYSAKWHADEGRGRRLQLLSTSADNTLAIWEADPSSGVWVTSVRLGEISREKGATTATGSTGGFWTGLWSPDGTSVTCLGRTGSWRVWDYSEAEDQWTPQIGIGGHTRAVTGIAWAKSGDYLLSTSADQTTRLHASWKRHGGGGGDNTWHEMARPQIHGYDLNCIDSLGDARFVSGADEKLMRVFDEPKAVARLLGRLCGITSDGGVEAMPDAASVPVLGLSNKAIETENDDDDKNNPEATTTTATETAADPEESSATARRSAALDAADRPPLEDALSRHTLWPEAEKLYGHGYEVSCLAASGAGDLVASACRASSVNHAVIRLFETRRWTEVRPPLAAHALTATRLRFSPGDHHLLSVGRDRQWAVFEREARGPAGAEKKKEEERKDGDGGEDHQPPSFKLLQSNPKGHSRMILDAAWAPTTTDLVFATAGRDKTVKIWRRGEAKAKADETGSSSSNNNSIVCVTTIPEAHPVTAIDFRPLPLPLPLRRTDNKNEEGQESSFVLAVGTEAGKISVYTLDATSLAVSSSFTLGAELCLAKPVLQMAWRPPRATTTTTRSDSNELAVAGEDGTLRIYRIALDRDKKEEP